MVLASPCKADIVWDDSGSHWLPFCRIAIDAPQDIVMAPAPGSFNVGLSAGMCAGMVQGIASLTNLLSGSLSSCLPSGVTTTQMMRVVVSYGEAHPERTHENIQVLMVEAFHQAWPCG
jgi:hypothetical protein